MGFLGTPVTGIFRNGTAMAEADDRITYNKGTGTLYFALLDSNPRFFGDINVVD